jgi:elongator complex protein 2
LMYVSGSEEKVLRVFEAPQTFTESLTAVRALQSPAAAAATAAALAAAATSSSAGSDAAAGSSTVRRGRALGASVSALGLSNKAVYVDDEADSAGLGNGDESSAAGAGAGVGAEAYMEGPDFVPTAVPAVVSGPPLEEHLAQNTLWPEVRKLYGHGNDVFCACSSPSGRVIASACKAQSTGAAAVWVWEVGSWKALAQLPGHTLTVTQLEFSPDASYLLSGSRDRSFCVWKVPLQYRTAGAAAAAAGSAQGAAAAAAAAAGWELVVRLKAAHSRIIWSVSWSHDGR